MHPLLSRPLRAAVAAGLLAALSAVAGAEAYPSKPIKIVVGFPAGGPTDVLVRTLAQEMAVSLGQPMIVENKSGAAGDIAATEVVRAAPDGYTLLFTTMSLVVNPHLQVSAKYDPLTDLTPIGLIAELPQVLLTGGTSPYSTLEDLVKAARKEPGAVPYAAASLGSQLATELFTSVAKVKMNPILYRGGNPALNDLMSGQVAMMLAPNIGLADLVAARKVKVLAAAYGARLSNFPTVPTLAELGYANVERASPWVGMLGPAKLSPDAIKRLNAAMNAALAKPEIRSRLQGLGAEVAGGTPGIFAAQMRTDSALWAKIARESGVQASIRN